MKRLTKQEKLDKFAAVEILAELNNFLSRLSDISNETGFQIPDLYHNSLSCLHRELCERVNGE